MASINLKHTSGNGTILNSPAANPSADITLKLPSTTGSAGQVLKVASANHSSTNAELEFAAGGGGTGSLLETITGQCDGRVVVGASGSYTFPNVTAVQTTTDTFTDITGSSISYTPPTGTKRVVYRFSTYHGAVTYSGITYMKLLVDGTEVTQGREVISYDYQGSAHSVERIINEYTFITDADSEDVANGKFTSWSSAKTIKFQAMRHGSSYTATFHKIRYWVDGSGNPSTNSDAKPPMLTIQSFA